MATGSLSSRRGILVRCPQLLGVSEEDWQRVPPRIRRAVAGVFDILLEEIQRLREQVTQTSRNSSRPPSADPPSVPAREKPPTGRTRGGQHGHPGQSRPLVPEDQVDKMIPVRPSQCERCGQHFAPTASDPPPRRHQVHEVLPVVATVTEYQLHTVRCPGCGRLTPASLPPGVPQGMLGPRALAIVATCTGCYHLSKRATAALLEDLCGLRISEATICAAEQTMSAALAAPVAEAQEALRQAPDKGIDETGWLQQRDPDSVGGVQEHEESSAPTEADSDAGQAAPGRLPKAWLWVATSARATIFLIRRSRGARVVEELLGKSPSGFIHTDRWTAYNWLSAWWRQLCWAHLRRDFVQLSERSGASARIGSGLLAQTQRLFVLWHRYRDGPLSWREFQAQMVPLQETVGALLREGAALGQAPEAGAAQRHTAHTCQHLLRWEVSLWTFVRVEGIEPTNNHAERAVRAAVLYRKVSFGTQCSAGSRYVERVLSAVATCKQHRRNLLDYLTTAAAAHLRREPIPSLLPTPGAA